MKRTRYGLVALCSALLAAGALSGCSSSTDASTTSDDSSSDSSSDALVVASAAPLNSPAYQIPEYEAGLTAAMMSINAAGGIKGRQIELSVCDTQFSVNGEVACANQMVADKAVAVVAPFFAVEQAGTVWKTLEAAKIPAIGGQGGSPAEMNSPVSFPLGSAFMGPYQGAAAAIEKAGAKNVTVLADSPNPAGSFATELIAGALKDRGITQVKDVTAVPASDPTFATAAAQASADGVDGIVLDATPTSNAGLIKALRAGGYTGTIAVPALLIPAEVIQALGADADGVVLDSTTAFLSDESNPGIAKFKADMAEYQPDAPVTDASLQAWSGMQLFAEASAAATTLDAAGLTDAYNAQDEEIDLGTSGPWSVVGKLGSIPGFSRIVNPQVTFGTIQDGKVVPQDGGFTNPFMTGAS